MSSDVANRLSPECCPGAGWPDPAVQLEDEHGPVKYVPRNLEVALRARGRLFAEQYPFAPGDLVTWKPGLKNRSQPGYARPAVVLAVLETPVSAGRQGSGPPGPGEPLDLVLGVLVDAGPHRGAFLAWHFNSRRFNPWIEEV